MQRTESPLIALAILLAALAGFVDALAFTSMGGFFASFMSGNSTRLGVGLGSGSAHDAAMAASLVMSFVAGVILSTVIGRARPQRHQPAVMAVVTLLLTLAAVLAALMPGPVVLLLLAAAMGTENGVFHRDGEVTIGVTYMTGSLVKMGQKLAGALMGDADRFGWLRYFGLWFGFVCGVVIGAESQFRWGWSALWLAPIFAGVLTLLLASMTRPRPMLTPVR